jgi:biotin carboxyl carrier protein
MAVSAAKDASSEPVKRTTEDPEGDATAEVLPDTSVGDVPRWGDNAVIVAPCSGRFVATNNPCRQGSIVYSGAIVGHVVGYRRTAPVISRFTGIVEKPLVISGARVRTSQPLLWLKAGKRQ